MKNCLLFIVALGAITFASCNKNNTNWPTELSGTWHIVSDSTYSSGIGPYGTPSGQKYIGTVADYFKFDGNKLSIKEGNIRTATATYVVSKDTLKLSYSYLDEGGTQITGATNSYVISQLDSRNLQLRSFLASPGGLFTETIILSH